MGCGQSTLEEDGAAKQRSDMIETELKKTERELRQDIKVLFLGAGGEQSIFLAVLPESLYTGGY